MSTVRGSQRGLYKSTSGLPTTCRGINRLDESVAHLVRPLQSPPTIGAHRELVDQLVRWAESAAGQPWPPFHLTGQAGAGKKTIASEFCARAGLQLYALDLRRLLQLHDTERHQLLHLLEREAVLSRLALYVDTSDFDPADPPRWRPPRLDQTLRRSAVRRRAGALAHAAAGTVYRGPEAERRRAA